MDANWIILACVVIDTGMEHLDHQSDVRAQVLDAEIVTIAVVAAKYFAHHHERTVQVMQACGYLSGRISVSRFNRRLHCRSGLNSVSPSNPWATGSPPTTYWSFTVYSCPFVDVFVPVAVVKAVAVNTAGKAFNSAADEGSILQDTHVRLVPVRWVNMKPHAWFLDV